MRDRIIGYASSFCAPWVRIASSVLSARDPFLFNALLAESTLEAMRTQGAQNFDAHPVAFTQLPRYVASTIIRFQP